MQNFKINKNSSINCKSKGNKVGFIHKAALLINNQLMETVKIQYHNRTWEMFSFQTALRKLINQTEFLTKKQKNIFIKKYNLNT